MINIRGREDIFGLILSVLVLLVMVYCIYRDGLDFFWGFQLAIYTFFTFAFGKEVLRRFQ